MVSGWPAFKGCAVQHWRTKLRGSDTAMIVVAIVLGSSRVMTGVQPCCGVRLKSFACASVLPGFRLIGRQALWWVSAGLHSMLHVMHMHTCVAGLGEV